MEGAEPMIIVRAVNLGYRPIELRSVCFRASTGEAIVPSGFPEDLPRMLGDGESFNAYFDEFRIDEAAADADVQLTHVAVVDAEGNQYTAPYPPSC